MTPDFIGTHFQHNLDGMSVDELKQFVHDAKEAASVLYKLRLYAELKAHAMLRRSECNLRSAENYESQCDQIYKSLPDAGRFW